MIRNVVKEDNAIKKVVSNRFEEAFLLLYDPVIEINDLLLKTQLVIIIDILSKFDDLNNNRLRLRFKLRNELFYYINFDDKRKRLYIFNVFE